MLQTWKAMGEFNSFLCSIWSAAKWVLMPRKWRAERALGHQWSRFTGCSTQGKHYKTAKVQQFKKSKYTGTYTSIVSLNNTEMPCSANDLRFSWETFFFPLITVFLVWDISHLYFQFQPKIPSNIFNTQEVWDFFFFSNSCFAFFKTDFFFSSVQFFLLERIKCKSWLLLMIHNCTFCGFNVRNFFFCNRH